MTVLVVGESLIDVVRGRDGIVERHPGGSPMNVAVGLARLGHRVRLATRIGTDADGDLLRRHVEADGVELAPGSVDAGATSTATAVLDAHGGATYDIDLRWPPPTVDLTHTEHVHAGSLGTALAPGGEQVRRLLTAATRAGLTTSYDPNLRPRLLGTQQQERPVVEGVVAGVDVVKASAEDLAWLYGGDPVAAARRWAHLGPRLVVLTLGADGAIAWVRRRPHESVRLPAPVVDVADTVGAGDAFMSGLLSGLVDAGLLAVTGPGAGALGQWSAHDVRPALQRALRVSSLTCARRGADPPRRHEL